MRTLLTVCLVLLLSPSADARPWFRWTTAGAIAAHGADLSTTAWCRGANTCHEANPALRWAEDSPMALGVTKMGVAAGLQLLNYRIWKTHPKTALAINVGQMILFSAIAVRNTRTLPPSP